jgi:hypothetical protein
MTTARHKARNGFGKSALSAGLRVKIRPRIFTIGSRPKGGILNRFANGGEADISLLLRRFAGRNLAFCTG